MTQLYHYTCGDHGAPGIRATGKIVPNQRDTRFGEPILWLTDLDVPDRYMLGLTSFSLPCDRTEIRFEVDAPDAVWWPRYARQVPRDIRALVESAPSVRPAHWYVSPVPAVVL